MREPDPSVAEREAIRLEEEGRLQESLALCERVLGEHRFDEGDPESARLRTQFSQRRLRLRRKLGLPVRSSQGVDF